MSIKVIVCENALDRSSWTTHTVDSLCAFLAQQFQGYLPADIKIFKGEVSNLTDITPDTVLDIEALEKLKGTIYVVRMPGKKAMKAISSVFSFLMPVSEAKPKMPTAQTYRVANRELESPNNELAQRENRQRMNARIPDIFGTVRSTPDLLALPYVLFEDNQEVEISYMCIGRGQYSIAAESIQDGETRILDIAGVSAEIYGPNTSPNTSVGVEGVPQLQVGTAINEPVLIAKKSNSVNGQEVRPPNAGSLQGNFNIRFVGPDQIQRAGDSNIKLADYFEAGDVLVVTGAVFAVSLLGPSAYLVADATVDHTGTITFLAPPLTSFTIGDMVTLSQATFVGATKTLDLNGRYVISGVSTTWITLEAPGRQNASWDELEAEFAGGITGAVSLIVSTPPAGAYSLSLNGTFTVLSATPDIVTLSNPTLSAPQWALLGRITGGATAFGSPLLTTASAKWVGPFILEEVSRIYANFVAYNGLYKDNGQAQTRFDVVCELEATPINLDNQPTGPAVTTQVTIIGSATTRSSRASTLRYTPDIAGRYSVRARRITNTDKAFNGTVSDEIKLRDLYSMKYISDEHFGDVTTIMTRTYATSGALSVKERKLNMLVTRMVPLWNPTTRVFSALQPTSRADHIFTAICLDPKLGGRTISELDLDNIYGAISAVESYMGFAEAVEFCHTFDDTNISFEEMASTVAGAVFCVAYRQGQIIRLKPDLATSDSVLLFNHRNKIPGSESRVIRFGLPDDIDGLELEWTNPKDEARESIYLPDEVASTNPKRVETAGIRNKAQALLHLHREWNRALHQYSAVQFEATAEAQLLILQDRILVADGTRNTTHEGQIEQQTGLILKLSQEISWQGDPANHTIFVQHTEGVVEGIPVAAAGDTPYELVLTHAPQAPLSLSDENYAKATYILTPNSSNVAGAFLMTSRSPQGSRGTHNIEAINYDFAYYLFEGLVAWGNFSKGAADASARSVSSAAYNGAVIIADLTRGPVLSLPAVNARLSWAVALPSQYTIALWALLGPGGAIVCSSQGTEALLVDQNDVVLRHGTDSITVMNVLTSAWHHLAATFEGDLASIYIDGVLKANGTLPSVSTNSSINLGGILNITSAISKLSDARIYKRALSADEIAVIWAKTRL